MALQIEKPSAFGVPAMYHKVSCTSIGWHNHHSQIEVTSYVSAQTRRDGFAPVEMRGYNWTGDEFPFSAETNVLEVAYTKLKTLEEWEGSVDA